jgi:hypothetical protein
MILDFGCVKGRREGLDLLDDEGEEGGSEDPSDPIPKL